MHRSICASGKTGCHQRVPLSAGGIRSMTLLLFVFSAAHAANPENDLFELDDLRVKITEELPYLKVRHKGQEVIIMRRQDIRHTIDPPFNTTARDCPPFCILPMTLHPAVETIGELEVLEYLRRVSLGDPGVLVIDSRTEDYTALGTIPGSVSIPYTQLDLAYTPATSIADMLQLEFRAIYSDELWDFQNAKTLVLFCNGPWCEQSPSNISSLLRMGYPADKLKWYRGGIQSWEQFGLTTVKD